MKQLEVEILQIWQRNHLKHNTELFHNYKENIWLKNMQLVKSKRCFISLETYSKRVFNYFKKLPVLSGR